MKTIIKNTVILFVITLVAGLGLGFVYNVTSKARAEQEEKTKLSGAIMSRERRLTYIRQRTVTPRLRW